MKITSIFALASTLLAVTALSTSAQIVTNGDFSANAAAFTTFPGYINTGTNPSGNPMGIVAWAATGTNLGINGNDTTTSNPFAPSSLADLSGSKDFAFLQFNGTGLSQAITLTPGQTYTLSYEGAGRSGDQSVSGYGAITDGNGTNLLFLAANGANEVGFSSYSANFTATTASETLTVGNFSAGGDRTFDISDISVVPVVPEPQPALIGLTFLGALGGWRLLRRRSSEVGTC